MKTNWLICQFYPRKRTARSATPHVRFGSKGDMCAAKLSAVPSKADMCVALAYVCLGQKADMPSCPCFARRTPSFGLFRFRTRPSLFGSFRPSPFRSRRGLRRHLLAPLIDQLLLGTVIFIEIEIAVAVAGNTVAFTMLRVLPEPPLRECRFWPAWRT